jgi:hypothetical protein
VATRRAPMRASTGRTTSAKAGRVSASGRPPLHAAAKKKAPRSARAPNRPGVIKAAGKPTQQIRPARPAQQAHARRASATTQSQRRTRLAKAPRVTVSRETRAPHHHPRLDAAPKAN